MTLAFSQTELIVLAVCAVGLTIQLFFALNIFLRAALNRPIKSTNIKPVSVVICARNEEKRLMDNLPHIFEQDHPDFEVIVVNDSSWDDTKEILKAFEVKHKNLHVIHLDEEKHRMGGKKFALTLGIKAAKNEHLIFTDADCKPNSTKWLREMAKGFTKEKQLILGVSLYEKQPGLLNILIRFDAWMVANQYIGFARARLPYMGVGRNMGYAKSLFFEQGGFRSHYHIASGDDDLFVQKASNKRNTETICEQQFQTTSEPKTTFKSWWWQKKRHFTTSKLYKGKYRFLLGLYPLSFLLFICSLIVLEVLTKNHLLVTGLIGVRYALLFTIFIVSSKRMGQRDLIWLFPIWELIIFVLQPMILLSNIIQKPKEWA